jgi:alpha-beta hydrolase superfamily lysophospholipase
MTLFVIRTEVTDRSILNELEQWYQEKRYKGLAVILNGSYDSLGRYGYHRYGYHRYGYHSYGYHTYGAN